MQFLNPYLTYIKLGGLALLLALLGLQTWRLHNAQADLTNCNLRNTAQVATYRATAATQIATQTVAKAKTEAAQDANTKDIDNEYQARHAALLAGLDADAAHRVRQSSAANPSGALGSDLPQVPHAAQGSNGPGGDTAQPADEPRICGTNTLRLLELQKWLIDQAPIHNSFPAEATTTNDPDQRPEPAQHP